MDASFLPPFPKGGQGGLANHLVIPLNPPLEKGDFETGADRPGQIIARQFMKHDNKPGGGVEP